jgi:hypothetical protein
MTRQRTRVGLFALAALSAVLLAGCGGEDGAPATTATTSPTPSTSGTTAPTSTGTSSTSNTGGTGAATGSATLTWYPPTQNTDGSPLRNLGGYRIYWGTTQGTYPNSVTINNPGLATYVVEQLRPARWYFVVTALTTTGIESSFSNVATKTVQ